MQALLCESLLAQDRIHPHIGARFDLGHGVAGLKMLADRGALGKIIVDC